MDRSGSVPSITPGRPSAGDSVTAALHPFEWSGNPWSLAPIALLNAVLTILTLGVYNFWGRTEIRRRTWSSVRLLGEPLAYHGTPGELMRGFLSILLILLLPLFLLGTIVVVVYGQASQVFAGYQAGLFLVFYPLLMAIGYYRARRYRLSRTSWRGIRGTMGGSSGRYAALSWLTALAYPITLGWIAPYRAVLLQRRLVSETELGAKALRFSGTSGPLYGRFALLWFGTIILYVSAFGIVAYVIGSRLPGGNMTNPLWWMTLRREDWFLVAGAIVGSLFIWSLISSFYYAKLYNHVAGATELRLSTADGAPPVRFELESRGPGLIWLFVSNALITYLSLYVLKPVATARSMRYFVDRFRIVGSFDPSALSQSAAALDASGEGLAQAFDLDAF